MDRLILTVLPLCLSAVATAQQVDLTIREPDAALRFSVKSRFDASETRRMLINGEEGGFGGGRGQGGRGAGAGPGSSETSIEQDVVFDQGPGQSNWREYRKLTATEKRTGGDGTARESKVEGALQGKKVFLKTDAEGGLELVEGDGDKAQPIAANVARGVPGRVSLAGFAPGKAAKVGDEFDLGRGFVTSLRGLVHPVTPARGPDAGAGRGEGERPGRPQGGQGRPQGGQGGQGAFQGRAGMGGPGSTVIQLLSATKLDVDAKGKLVAVEQSPDGATIAVVEIKAKLGGKGTGEELGLGSPMGMLGGRGGRGQDAPPMPTSTDKVDASFAIGGTVRIDVGTHQVVGASFQGDLDMKREVTMAMDRNGEQMKMENATATKGKFRLELDCQQAK